MAYREVESIHAEYAARRTAICERLADFARVPPDTWFYELAYCLLTPQSSAVNASHAVDALQATDFLDRGEDPTHLLRNGRHYIRFHNTKARRLLEARQTFAALRRELEESRARDEACWTDGRNLRLWLLKNIRGLGWKEASHFLRNIGYRNLAILDRHILRNLKKHGAVRSFPKSLTPKRYCAIERSFLKFSDALGIPMDELDLLFWSRETGEIRK